MSLSYTNPQHTVKQCQVMQTFLTLLLVKTMFIRKREFRHGYFLGKISVIPWVSFIAPIKCSWVFFISTKCPLVRPERERRGMNQSSRRYNFSFEVTQGHLGKKKTRQLGKLKKTQGCIGVFPYFSKHWFMQCYAYTIVKI